MSSLSHSMTWRSAIAAGSIGTSSSSRSSVSTKPPGCCDRCRGAPISCLGQLQRQAQPAVAEVEVELGGVLRADVLAPAPDRGGKLLGHVLGQAERLADVAQRPLGAIADHRRAERGVIAAVGLEHPLHDDLAALVLEVDVDVGRLAALLGDEALEQQVVALGIDRGDAEHVADGRVRRRAAPLAQDVLASGRSARSSSPSGSTARTPASRSARARAAGCRPPRRAGLRDSASPRPPRSAAPAPAAASGRASPPRADTGRPARRARSGSARRSPACARAPRDSGGTAAPSPRAASGSDRHGARDGSRRRRWRSHGGCRSTTSCRMRRAGTWNSTSLVTTVGTRACAARLDSSCSRSWSFGRRRRVSAR